MKISGASTLDATPEQVWEAILDPAVLATCLPGCQELTALGEDRYGMTVTAGVAAVKGTYTGEVSLRDKVAPSSLTLRASGAGAPGTIEADVLVRLDPSPTGGTALSYDADAAVGGTIGGVGQRMLGGVTKKLAEQFFTAIDEYIAAGGSASAAPMGAGPGVTGSASTGPLAGSPTGSVFTGRRSATAGSMAGRGRPGIDFAAGVVLGGAMALIGVVIGSRIARRG